MVADENDLEIGGRPRGSVKQGPTGETTFEERGPNGTHKVTTVDPDGSYLRLSEKTDPATGITTQVRTFSDGHSTKTTEFPGGDKQVVTNYKGGKDHAVTKTFTDPDDGSKWTETTDRKFQTTLTHDYTDDKGVKHHVVQHPNGSRDSTSTTTTKLPGNKTQTVEQSSTGEKVTTTREANGDSEVVTKHANGKIETDMYDHDPDGKFTHTHVGPSPEFELTRMTRWKDENGHEHTTMREPSGKTSNYESWEDPGPNNTTIQHRNGPGKATQMTTTQPNGSHETVGHNEDGSTSKFTHTVDPTDGSITEINQENGVTTNESYFAPTPNGGFRTLARDYTNRTEIRTSVNDDGTVDITGQGPKGRVKAHYEEDGSGVTKTYTADGRLRNTVRNKADANPTPSPANPKEWLENAHKQMDPSFFSDEVQAGLDAEQGLGYDDPGLGIDDDDAGFDMNDVLLGEGTILEEESGLGGPGDEVWSEETWDDEPWSEEPLLEEGSGLEGLGGVDEGTFDPMDPWAEGGVRLELPDEYELNTEILEDVPLDPLGGDIEIDPTVLDDVDLRQFDHFGDDGDGILTEDIEPVYGETVFEEGGGEVEYPTEQIDMEPMVEYDPIGPDPDAQPLPESGSEPIEQQGF